MSSVSRSKAALPFSFEAAERRIAVFRRTAYVARAPLPSGDSGGVSSPYDIANLKALERPNLRAAIVGKALYDGRTTLRDMNIAAV